MATIVQKHENSVVNRGHYQVPGPAESRTFPDGSSLVRGDHIPWTPWVFEGSEFKLLSVSRSTGHFFTLIRFKNGPITLPDHHHFSDVHAYVLEGDFSYEYGTMNKGDYLLESGGVNHAPTIGAKGATFLVHFMGPVSGVSPEGYPDGVVVDAEWMYRAAAANGAADHLPKPAVPDLH
jgi:anti-sigma factor ChrR (cupin superfamily)